MLSNTPFNPRSITLALLLLFAGLSFSHAAQDELTEEATWVAPSREVVQGNFLALADEAQLNDTLRQQLAELWNPSNPQTADTDLLQLGLLSCVIIAPQCQDLVTQLQTSLSPFDTLDQQPLTDEALAPWLRKQLILATGSWCAQNQLYDEAIDLLTPLNPEDVIDPVALLFYRGLSYQQVIQKDPALKDLKQLLERESELPRRYRDVAKLVVADLEPLEADSLDEISRMMDDIRRRQGLNRSGTRVRKEEDDVIAKLDKLIEELEQQQQQQQMMASSSNSPSSPAPDSMLKGGGAPGDVDQKAQGSGEDWGDLPAKERAAAMAELAKDLPSHYRELIEEYYRKLAEDPNTAND